MDEHPATDPLWFLVGGAGLVVAFVSLFLPEADANSFATIAQNTLLQHGGWKIAIGIVLCGIGLYRRWQNPSRQTLSLVILGGIGVAFAVLIAKNSFGDLTLCSIVDGVQTATNCEKANPGIGVYALGIGSGMVTLAALNLGWFSRRQVSDAPVPLDQA